MTALRAAETVGRPLGPESFPDAIAAPFRLAWALDSER